MRPTDFFSLYYSPYWCSKILWHFLSGVKKQQNSIKFELIYWALPFCLNEDIKESLNSAKISSTFLSLFNKDDERMVITSMNMRIAEYKELTNTALLLLGQDVIIEFGEFITIDKIVDYKIEKNSYRRRYFKAAFNFGVICSKENPYNLFLKLGVTEI